MLYLKIPCECPLTAVKRYPRGLFKHEHRLTCTRAALNKNTIKISKPTSAAAAAYKDAIALAISGNRYPYRYYGNIIRSLFSIKTDEQFAVKAAHIT